MTTQRTASPATLAALATGCALTAASIALPYVDRATSEILAGHILAGYPHYSPGEVDDAVTLWMAILTGIGAVGIAGWSWTLWAARTGRRWVTWSATVLLVVGAGVAWAALAVKDTSGDTGLPPLYGWLGMLPSVAGLAAVVGLWRGQTSASPGSGRRPPARFVRTER